MGAVIYLEDAKAERIARAERPAFKWSVVRPDWCIGKNSEGAVLLMFRTALAAGGLLSAEAAAMLADDLRMVATAAREVERG